MAIRKILKKLKNLSKFDHAISQGQVDRAIKKFIQDNRLIVHGSRAMNAQAQFPHQRAARDYDIFTESDSKPVARKLHKILDELRGGNYHYVKQALHRKTNMLMDVGADLKKGTRDDFELASLTKIPRKRFSSVEIDNILYAHLDELEKAKVRALRYKKYTHRWQKDKADLETIRLMKKLKGGMFFL